MAATKHIVIDGRFFRRTTGGIGRYSQALVRELIRLDRNHRYTLIIRPADRADWQALADQLQPNQEQWQVKIVDIPHYSLAEQSALVSLLRQLKPDLVHFTNFNHPISWRQPFVITIHDLTIQKFPVGHRQSSPIFQWGLARVLAHAAARATAIITVSETSKNDLMRQRRLRPGQITVTYEGVDKVFQPVNLPLRGRTQQTIGHQMGIRPPYFLFVSQWRPHKGLPNLIRAYELFRDENPRLTPQLIVVGQANPAYPAIGGQIIGSPYATDIIRPGFIDEKTLVHLDQTAEAFIFPSLYEGFGLPPLEAMAAGTPVIASATSCLPEILGNAAYFVPPNDSIALAKAMVSLLTDRGEWRRLRSAGLAHARQFSWEKMANQTLAVYQRVLESS